MFNYNNNYVINTDQHVYLWECGSLAVHSFCSEKLLKQLSLKQLILLHHLLLEELSRLLHTLRHLRFKSYAILF